MTNHFSTRSVLVYYKTFCYISCSAADKKALQRFIDFTDKYSAARCPFWWTFLILVAAAEQRTMKDSMHLGYYLFEMLPSWRHFKTVSSRSERLRDSKSILPGKSGRKENVTCLIPIIGKRQMQQQTRLDTPIGNLKNIYYMDINIKEQNTFFA